MRSPCNHLVEHTQLWDNPHWMGLLKHVATGIERPLPHCTLVGRSVDAELRITNPRASTQHAVLAWNDGGWRIKDLASRNGTVVDGRRLPPGEWIPIAEGMTLCFGLADECWTVSSDQPPGVTATCLATGQVLEGEHGYLCIADGAVVSTDDGEQYVLEVGGRRARVKDREMVKIDHAVWRISLPPPLTFDSQTVTAEGVFRIDQLTLRFEVSRDEEHIEVSLHAPALCRKLRQRSFDYMLLALARARVADERDTSLTDAEHGWVYADELAMALQMDVTHLNVDIYRARHRFGAAGVRDADQLIERRWSTHMVRLGCRRIEIACL